MAIKTNQKSFFACFFAALLIAGCSEETLATSGVENETQNSATVLSAEYLAGTWCNSERKTGDMLGRPNITYLFEDNGGLLYQKMPGAEEMSPGRWQIDGARLKLLPMFVTYTLNIKSVAPDAFVLEGRGEHRFQRGTCAKQESDKK